MGTRIVRAATGAPKPSCRGAPPSLSMRAVQCCRYSMDAARSKSGQRLSGPGEAHIHQEGAVNCAYIAYRCVVADARTNTQKMRALGARRGSRNEQENRDEILTVPDKPTAAS